MLKNNYQFWYPNSIGKSRHVRLPACVMFSKQFLASTEHKHQWNLAKHRVFSKWKSHRRSAALSRLSGLASFPCGMQWIRNLEIIEPKSAIIRINNVHRHVSDTKCIGYRAIGLWHQASKHSAQGPYYRKSVVEAYGISQLVREYGRSGD